MTLETSFPLFIVHRRLERGVVLAEALLFPELARLGTNRDLSRKALADCLAVLVPEMSPAGLGRRRMIGSAQMQTFRMEIPPPKGNIAWREPVPLKFPILIRPHGNEAVIARVPDLGIEIVVTKPADLADRLKKDILSAIRRDKHSLDLRRLSLIQRTVAASLTSTTLRVSLPSLKQRAKKELENSQQKEESVLKQIGRELKSGQMDPAFEMESLLETLAEMLTSTPPQSVLLVGPGGVGKTALVRELVRERIAHGLGSRPFWHTSGSRLVAGMCGFGMWQERCRALWKECTKQRAILHLGHLVELMEVGKSEHNQTGIAGFLRPWIARGDLLTIAECTPEQIALIEREDPQLLDAFTRLNIEEPGRQPGLRILTKVVEHQPLNLRKSLEPLTLETLDQLHRRYATYSAWPGRPLRFLENLLRDHDGDRLNPGDVLTAFTRETGLPRFLLDPDIPLDVAETRQWFSRRVIGQTEAVHLVVDLLCTIKAGLSRPGRPLASLLFIGPTGVGKTEMARTLAEFLFGSRERVTRFDMSEYSDAISVRRLVGGGFGTEGLLTARVREQPFSVLLLDEFEKAHHSFFDLLLQVFGEARLTDAGGRLADFRNAVIILTSNLGADTYSRGVPGFPSQEDRSAKRANEHFIRATEEFLRPEMFARIDRLVPFAPLEREIIQKIGEREWEKVLHRDGIRFRGVIVEADDAVKKHVASGGFDIRYGARPLKRAMERDLLAPLAEQMNRYSGDTALSIQIGMKENAPEIRIKPRLDQTGRVLSASEGSIGLIDAVREVSRQRRLQQKLETCSTVRDLHNREYQLAQREKIIFQKQQSGKNLTQSDQAHLIELGKLRTLLVRITELGQSTREVEEKGLLLFSTGSPELLTESVDAPRQLRHELQELMLFWDDLLQQVYIASNQGTTATNVGIFGEEKEWIFDLANEYALIAKEMQFPLKMWAFYGVSDKAREIAASAKSTSADHSLQWKKDVLVLFPQHGPPEAVLTRHHIDNPGNFLRSDRQLILGLLMNFSGDSAHLRFASEAGAHTYRSEKDRSGSRDEWRCVVDISQSLPEEYLPPDGISRKGGLNEVLLKRSWNQARREVRSERPRMELAWSGPSIRERLNEIMTLTVRHILEEMVLG